MINPKVNAKTTLVRVALFCILVTTLSGCFSAKPLPGTPLGWREVGQDTTLLASGRDRLNVTIVPTTDQGNASTEDLVSTVMQAAWQYQRQTGHPVVIVRMTAQEKVDQNGGPLLAMAIYIPDGKGHGGVEKIGPWDNVRATKRGFTAQELEYLTLWIEMHEAFQHTGPLDEKSLDAAISKRMNIAPGSLSPWKNVTEGFDIEYRYRETLPRK